MAHTWRMDCTPTNLYLPADVVAAAREYVKHRKRFRRGFSMSELVTQLVVKKLIAEGVKLPEGYYEKETVQG